MALDAASLGCRRRLRAADELRNGRVHPRDRPVCCVEKVQIAPPQVNFAHTALRQPAGELLELRLRPIIRTLRARSCGDRADPYVSQQRFQ